LSEKTSETEEHSLKVSTGSDSRERERSLRRQERKTHLLFPDILPKIMTRAVDASTRLFSQTIHTDIDTESWRERLDQERRGENMVIREGRENQLCPRDQMSKGDSIENI
jgi:hypothetical protein